MSLKLLIRSARQIVLITSKDKTKLCGKEMSSIEVLEDENGLSIAVDLNGKIIAIGTDSNVREQFPSRALKEIDVSGCCILPGFVDAHTHPVWSGDRVHEFSLKMAGVPYMEIYKTGGGIHYTVEHTRQSSEKELALLLRERLNKMLSAGTTLVECKSGYGLDVDTEMKLLRVLEQAKKELPIEISTTFCGAHAIPKGMTSEEATGAVVDEQLPQLKALISRGEVTVENIDVFCEKGVFNVEESRRILQAGKKMGLKINFHGDELHPIGSAELAAELEATAVSHLECVSSNGINAMAKAGTVAVLLPTTALELRLNPPPARQLLEAGVAIALGSDFNPNAYCVSMPLVMHLSCALFHLSPSEALAASTLNAAASIGRGHSHGSIQLGKVADMVIIKAPRWEHIIYQIGEHNNLINIVLKNGDIVYKK